MVSQFEGLFDRIFRKPKELNESGLRVIIEGSMESDGGGERVVDAKYLHIPEAAAHIRLGTWGLYLAGLRKNGEFSKFAHSGEETLVSEEVVYRGYNVIVRPKIILTETGSVYAPASAEEEVVTFGIGLVTKYQSGPDDIFYEAFGRIEKAVGDNHGPVPVRRL